MSVRCETARELLPWLLNGSLSGQERASLLEHLAACPACAGELTDTRAVWEIFSQHLPARDIVAHAIGLGGAETPRSSIERHLARCPSCRREFELVQRSEDATAEKTRISRPLADVLGRGRRFVADLGPIERLAATVAVLAVGLLVVTSVWMSSQDRGEAVPPPGSESTQARIGVAASSPPQEPRAIVFADGFEQGSTTQWPSEPEGETSVN